MRKIESRNIYKNFILKLWSGWITRNGREYIYSIFCGVFYTLMHLFSYTHSPAECWLDALTMTRVTVTSVKSSSLPAGQEGRSRTFHHHHWALFALNTCQSELRAPHTAKLLKMAGWSHFISATNERQWGLEVICEWCWKPVSQMQFIKQENRMLEEMLHSEFFVQQNSYSVASGCI